jgi:hypothetical protein
LGGGGVPPPPNVYHWSWFLKEFQGTFNHDFES